jgi:hypothetical protein
MVCSDPTAAPSKLGIRHRREDERALQRGVVGGGQGAGSGHGHRAGGLGRQQQPRPQRRGPQDGAAVCAGHAQTMVVLLPPWGNRRRQPGAGAAAPDAS